MIVLAALVAAGASASENPLPSHFSRLPQATVEVLTATGPHRFQVWIAADDASRELGLMHVRDLPADRGMLFLFERPQYVAFWMKDTFVSLDLVFIGPDGVVVNIREHATPHSLEAIESDGPVFRRARGSGRHRGPARNRSRQSSPASGIPQRALIRVSSLRRFRSR